MQPRIVQSTTPNVIVKIRRFIHRSPLCRLKRGTLSRANAATHPDESRQNPRKLFERDEPTRAAGAFAWSVRIWKKGWPELRKRSDNQLTREDASAKEAWLEISLPHVRGVADTTAGRVLGRMGPWTVT